MLSKEQQETAKVLAIGLSVVLALLLASTPVCVWLHGVDNCESLFCELMAMRRPLADVSYCEWWFDLFR